jgi:hypothetical protein
MRNSLIKREWKRSGRLFFVLVALAAVCPGSAKAASDDLAKGVDAVNRLGGHLKSGQ